MTAASDGSDPEKDAGGKTGADAPDRKTLANAYLDFWQLNLMRWSADPSLFEEWAMRILEPGAPGGKHGDAKDR